MSQNIQFSAAGLPETVLPPAPSDQQVALDAAWSQPEATRRAAVAAVVVRWPRFIEAWARLGDLGRDEIEQYAAYRVGYHRGLDTLRQNGWRGSGFVRWEHPSNRGFLRALAGLRRSAAAISEADEEERIRHFLVQLDPTWSDANLDD